MSSAALLLSAVKFIRKFRVNMEDNDYSSSLQQTFSTGSNIIQSNTAEPCQVNRSPSEEHADKEDLDQHIRREILIRAVVVVCLIIY